MKEIVWNKDKNEWLKAKRNICFEDVQIMIEKNEIVDTKIHFKFTKVS